MDNHDDYREHESTVTEQSQESTPPSEETPQTDAGSEPVFEPEGDRTVEYRPPEQPLEPVTPGQETSTTEASYETASEPEGDPTAEYRPTEETEEYRDPWIKNPETEETVAKPEVKLLLSSFKTPAILNQPDNRIQSNSAIIGIAVGVLISILIGVLSPEESVLGRLFGFKGIQVVLPVAMLSMFFWGIALIHFRRQKSQMVEKSSSGDAISDLTYNLAKYSPGEIHNRMAESSLVDKCPLFRRLSVIFRQWETKPNLQDAMSLAEQVSISDTEDIRHTFSTVKTFIWALPVLGLIGTVIGIALAVGDFGTLIGGNVDDVEVIKTSLVDVTSGLSFAFTTTLLGLLGALILTLLSSRQQTREEKLVKRAEETVVDHFLPLLQRSHPEEQQNGGLANFDDLRETVNGLVKEAVREAGNTAGLIIDANSRKLAEWQDKMMARNQQALLQLSDTSTKVGTDLDSFGQQFLSSLESLFGSLRENTQSLQANLERCTSASAESAAKLDSAMERHGTAAQAASAVIGQVQESNRTLLEEQKTLLSTLRELTGGEMNSALEGLSRSLEAIGRQNDLNLQALRGTSEANERISACQTSLQNNLRQIEDMGLATALKQMSENLDRASEVLKQFQEPIVFKAFTASSLRENPSGTSSRDGGEA